MAHHCSTLNLEDIEAEESFSGENENGHIDMMNMKTHLSQASHNYSGSTDTISEFSSANTDEPSSKMMQYNTNTIDTSDSNDTSKQNHTTSSTSPPPNANDNVDTTAPAVRKKKTMDPPARERPVNDVWPQRDALSFTRSLVFYGTGTATPEHEIACRYIMEAREMRKKYQKGVGTIIKDEYDNATREHCGLMAKMGEEGIMGVYRTNDEKFQHNLITVPNIDEFIKDYRRMVHICADGAMRSFCFQRLQMLDSAFKMHVTGKSNYAYSSAVNYYDHAACLFPPSN